MIASNCDYAIRFAVNLRPGEPQVVAFQGLKRLISGCQYIILLTKLASLKQLE